MKTMAQPRIRRLGKEECEAILARNHVGRIAYAWKNHVDIQPLHYVYNGQWLYGRTSPETKLDVNGRPVVAGGVRGGRGGGDLSVAQRGGARGILRHRRERAGVGGGGVQQGRGHAARADPGNARPRRPDPVPFRTVLFRIAVQEVSGREATPGEAASAAEP